MVSAPPLGRGTGKSQCCRQGSGGPTAGEPLTPLLARKTMCIPPKCSFSQFSPPASMTAPLSPSHGRGASWQVGELEFPSPAHFHLSFRAGRTAQPLGTETQQTQVRTTPGCCSGPTALGPSAGLRAAWTWHVQSRRNPTNPQELRQEHTPTSSQLSSTIPKEPKHPVFVLLMGRF